MSINLASLLAADVEVIQLIKSYLLSAGLGILALGVTQLAVAQNRWVPSQSLAMYFSPIDPAGLKGMVDNADLIIVGSITAIENEFMFYGYDEENAEKYKQLEEQSSMTLSLPSVDYRISVTEVLKDNGSRPLLLPPSANDNSAIDTRTEKPISIIYRKLASPPAVLDRPMMFFLGQNPDKTSYGTTHFANELFLIDRRIYYFDLSDKTTKLLRLAADLSVAEFTDAVKIQILSSSDN